MVIYAALTFRDHSGNSGCLLLTGLADLVLVYLIWSGWHGSAAWVIGLLADVNLIFT